MALRPNQPDMRLDFATSPPTTPIAQSPLWNFRPSFNPKSWSSGTTSVSPSTYVYCTQIAIQTDRPDSGRFNLVPTDRCTPSLFEPRVGCPTAAPIRRREPPAARGARRTRGYCAARVRLRSVHGHASAGIDRALRAMRAPLLQGLRPRVRRVTDRVAPLPRSVPDVYGRARKQLGVDRE